MKRPPRTEPRAPRSHRPILHQSVDVKRTWYDGSAPERIFAEMWAAEAKEQPGINHGHGVLQDLMFRRRIVGRWMSHYTCLFRITRRDAAIVATVVQWLGTNVGHCFLERVLNRCGYRLVSLTDKWNSQEPIRVCRSQTPHWNGNCPHCGCMHYQRHPRFTLSELARHAAAFGGTVPVPAVHRCRLCGGPFTIAAPETTPGPITPRLRAYFKARMLPARHEDIDSDRNQESRRAFRSGVTARDGVPVPWYYDRPAR